MKKVAVLGCGLVGKAIVKDLASDYHVKAVDLNPENLRFDEPDVVPLQADVSEQKTLKEILRDVDLVIGAVPGFAGYRMLQNVIALGKSIVDISFFPEDPFQLDSLASARKVCAVVDCGVAPGLSNMVAGYYQRQQKIRSFTCYVGGLPFERKLPWQYKAPFSPADVIEEYCRPARIKRCGEVVTVPALSGITMHDFPGIGTLESFVTDGLRTLLQTTDIPEMKEKTLRYPGHAALMATLRDSGFFSENPITVNGKTVTPREVVSRLLYHQWRLMPEDREFTLMRIEMEGMDGTVCFDLFDVTDEVNQISSMARTTGYTCTAVARLMLNGQIRHEGILPPEKLSQIPECYAFVIEYLKNKGVRIEIRENG